MRGGSYNETKKQSQQTVGKETMNASEQNSLVF